MWKEVGKTLGWKKRRRNRVSDLFYREEATEAVLEFLRTTGVGKYPPRPEEPVEDEEGDERGSEAE